MTVPAKLATSANQTTLLRKLPSVDELLSRPRITELRHGLRREYLVEIVREVLAEARREITAGVAGHEAAEPEWLEGRIVAAIEKELEPSLRPVINASGVILHTNLGRAPLTTEAIEEIRRSATQYSNLEYDIAAGERGKRDAHVARLLSRLTGAEAAIVVNNCAAAVLLSLAALARGGEVIVSRGELIEIGDGFRIPEIMEQSGAILREVGTTNRTRITDYDNAINDKTRVLLRVHPSNFTVSGFTEKPEVSELIALGERRGLPVVEDLGSGCLANLSEMGISEPTVGESVAAGFSLVLFSGDKLLGGPQAGIIAGRKELVARVRRHPLFRALRVDKLTTATLEATLRAYLRGAWDQIPSQQMIRATLEQVSERAKRLAESLLPRLAEREASLDIVEGNSLVGGGSTPSQSLPTRLVRVESKRYSAGELEKRLRGAPAGIPVIARIEEDRLLIDLRTVFVEQEAALRESLVAALS